MDYINFDEKLKALNCECLCNEPLSKYTSFKVGGCADRLIKVKDEKSLAKILKLAETEKIPVFILGRGSNILVNDNGFRGAVLILSGDFKKIRLEGDRTIVCGAGASLASLCSFARDNELTGLEFAWGIPGSAGGAAYMNAGAYDGEMKQVLHACKHITANGERGAFAGDSLELSYRHSVYTDKDIVITELTLILEKGSLTEITNKMDDLMNRRKSKQPLEYPSAGSTFKRPTGYFAGGLIEECGLKGAAVGGAQVSEKHAGFVINRNNASCKDILDLIELIKNTVKKEKGVDLECEVKII